MTKEGVMELFFHPLSSSEVTKIVSPCFIITSPKGVKSKASPLMPAKRTSNGFLCIEMFSPGCRVSKIASARSSLCIMRPSTPACTFWACSGLVFIIMVGWFAIVPYPSFSPVIFYPKYSPRHKNAYNYQGGYRDEQNCKFPKDK